METAKIDLVIQYALLAAGLEDDKFDRQLGPIHLIKYVYLADLAHAERNNGETFTGVDWQFYKFGPWSQTVHERIEPALLAIGADKITFPSNYDDKDDWVRWSIDDDLLFDEIGRKLPASITPRLRWSVRIFGKDTPSLLEYVYRSKPMLSAAPLELLNFTELGKQKPVCEDIPLRRESLTVKKRKKLKEGINALREKFEANFQSGLIRKKLVNPVPSPRYDEVYEKGLVWLDSLAGQPFPEGKMTANFDQSVWKSSTRAGNDIS